MKISNQLSEHQAKTKILILYTGGTIGMKPNSPNNPAAPLIPCSHHELLQRIGHLGLEKQIAWEMLPLFDLNEEKLPPLDSSQVLPHHWVTIARNIELHYKNYDGFVILHGTDTLAYTASMLSFLLLNLNKPVVITGAQSPIYHERTDAYQNLVNAIYLAGYKALNISKIPEVVVCFGDMVLRGNRTRKVSTHARGGFMSPNYPKLGTLGENIRLYPRRFLKEPNQHSPFYIHQELTKEVMDITLFPGIQSDHLKPIFLQSDIKGFILRTYGSGNMPEDPQLMDLIRQAASQGKIFLITTQCYKGRVDLGRYHTSSGLLEERIISGFDLTPEAALTKLMWLLSMEEESELPIQLQCSQRGEQSYNQYNLKKLLIGEQKAQKRYEISLRPPGPIYRDKLNRAVLRLTNVAYPQNPENPPPLTCYLNATGIQPGTSCEDIRCLALIELSLNEEGVLEGITDVTHNLQRLLIPERPLRLTLLSSQNYTIGQLELKVLMNY